MGANIIDLPEVTLLCFENRKLDEARSLLTAMMKLATFGDVQLRYNFKDYEEFKQAEFTAYKNITTPFYLTIHLDGYIVHPELWDYGWLRYDYIGAPWPPGEASVRVGNSGFSLRNTAFARFIGKKLTYKPINNDMLICQEYRKILEDVGYEFAPVEEAAKFSIEHRCPETPDKTFGFHGEWNYPEWKCT